MKFWENDICKKHLQSMINSVCVCVCVCGGVCVAAVMKLLVKVAPTPWDWLKLCVIA